MSPPIVIGFDGSEHGRDALALGRALASTLSTRLVVVVAYTPEHWLWAPGTAEPLDDSRLEAILDEARSLLAGFDDLEVRALPWPSAAGALHAEAERLTAQLIVVGSSHRGTIGRMLLGTVTEEVLDAAPCAVAVAPTGLAARELHLSRIGVGFDDGPCSREALAVAVELARRAGAEVRLVWAAHLAARALPLAAVSYMDADYFAELRAGVEAQLAAAAAPVREQVPVRSEILPGATVDALVGESEGMDLLILGSRGYGPIRRVLLGSISRHVVNRARCPVLIVPRGVHALEDQPSGSAMTDAEEHGNGGPLSLTLGPASRPRGTPARSPTQ
jgi:nucleotide-binding universal stress UspA family protein